ncbi:MAG: glycerol-3-phosphate 1-O-acyltransferase PlsY [Rhodobiaceae bacterium]|nr:glycerol-3-phosphate 1-O-acyltransferase PlsY [Rhodobiaceae bacterium]
MPDPISWSFAAPFLIGFLVLGYVLGSIPFGLVLTRMAGLGDIRSIGSGNIGTTNVLRTGRKDLAALTLLGDALKGTAAFLIGSQFGPDTAVLAGLGAFLGHLFPIWLKFRGGKGVATYLGVLLAAFWPVALIFAAIWIGMAAIFRYSSLSALTASVATPVLLIAFDEWQLAQLFAVMTLLLWIKHRQNIARLVTGKESKIGGKAATADGNAQ